MIPMPDWSEVATAFVGGGGVPIAAAAWWSFSPRSAFWGPVVWRVPAGTPAIALTFDDGPDPQWTPAILDTLGQHDATAMFFVIGRNVERCPDVLRRIVDGGHAIGGHTWDHHHHGYLGGAAYWRDQFDRTDEAIERAIGTRPQFFRPPMGMRTGHVMRAATERGQTVVTWTRRGFDGVRTTPAAIEQRLADRSRAGEIVVLHDGVEPHSRRSPAATAGALGPILRRWRERGLRSVRLDELLDRPGDAAETLAHHG